MGEVDARAQRFWAKVEKTDGCWLWQAGRDRDGYGVFGVKTESRWVQVRAHRLAYEMTLGSVPEGMWVLHRCDNPPCVNPEHLFLGTVRDNVDDSVRKGRHTRGSRNGTSKLTEIDIPWIRFAREYAGASFGRIAKAYGVTERAIMNITQGKNWTHV